MEKYNFDDWNTIHAYVLLPNGNGCGIMAFVGKDVPEKFTTHGFLKRWQRDISRNKERRRSLFITKTKEECPVCGGKTIYKSINKKGATYKWCGRFPDCNYQKITKRRITPNNYNSFICGMCLKPMKMLKDLLTNKTVYVCSDYPSCSYVYKNINKSFTSAIEYKKGK